MSETKIGGLTRSSLQQDVDAFIVDRRARGLAARTLEYYSEELQLLLTYLQGRQVLTVQDITPGLLRDYLLHLSERRKPRSVHASYRAARAFMLWYAAEFEQQDVARVIGRVSPPKIPAVPLPPLDIPDLQKMLATCERRTFMGDRDRALLLALLDSGARASEFLALDIGDIDIKTGAVSIRAGKGQKWRVAFLGTKCKRELLRYLRFRPDARPDSPLWITQNDKRLSLGGLAHLLERRATAAGVPAPSPHRFRRAFCLGMLRSGGDVASISRLLGHASLNLVLTYAKQTTGDLQRVHQQHSPVDRAL